MSTSALALEPVPLIADTHGVLRVGGTRVTLDTVVAAFETGATPEQIAEDYPLDLADVYATLTYYLRHRDEVSQYLSRRAAESDAIRQENREQFPSGDLRARLLARTGR